MGTGSGSVSNDTQPLGEPRQSGGVSKSDLPRREISWQSPWAKALLWAQPQGSKAKEQEERQVASC